MTHQISFIHNIILNILTDNTRHIILHHWHYYYCLHWVLFFVVVVAFFSATTAGTPAQVHIMCSWWRASHSRYTLERMNRTAEKKTLHRRLIRADWTKKQHEIEQKTKRQTETQSCNRHNIVYAIVSIVMTFAVCSTFFVIVLSLRFNGNN